MLYPYAVVVIASCNAHHYRIMKHLQHDGNMALVDLATMPARVCHP